MILEIPEGCAEIHIEFRNAGGFVMPESVVLQPHPPKPGTPPIPDSAAGFPGHVPKPKIVIPDSFLSMPPKPPKPQEEA